METYQRVYLRLGTDARRFGGASRWLLFRVLPVVLLAAMVLLCLGSLAARASASVQGEAEGRAGGHMLLRDERGEEVGRALLQASTVHFDISGVIATATLEQSFRNDTGRWLEGVYAFPLPDTAAVRAMEMRLGERRIVGKIREKTAAREIYREARSAGKTASLVEQQRPNLFTSRVANIAPGETVVVRLEYVQQLDYRTGAFSLRFPATITPRYMPGLPLGAGSDPEEAPALEVNPYLGWALPTTAVADADAISPLQLPQPGSELAPLNPLQVTVRLDMGIPLAHVEAPYHDIALVRRAGVYDISLANGVTEMDRDFVLAWRPVTGSEPTAALFNEEVAGEYYGLLLVMPPAIEKAWRRCRGKSSSWWTRPAPWAGWPYARLETAWCGRCRRCAPRIISISSSSIPVTAHSTPNRKLPPGRTCSGHWISSNTWKPTGARKCCRRCAPPCRCPLAVSCRETIGLCARSSS